MLSIENSILQHYKSATTRSLLLIPLLLLLSLQCYSQPIKQTNNWYFGQDAGVDFNSGEPIPLHNGMSGPGNPRPYVTMSDTNGNLLFYTSGWRLWNRNHYPITNTFVPSWIQMSSFPVIGSDHLYYVFGVPIYDPPLMYYKTSYAIIDMTMNGGLGGVSGDIIPLDAAWDAAIKITAAKHKNKQDIWVITRKYTENKYASFLVTENGVNATPVLSSAPNWAPVTLPVAYGQMKVSYDKKYLINCTQGHNFGDDSIRTEVCKFNDLTGKVDYLYSFDFKDPGVSIDFSPHGVEFSPDSKFLYMSFNHSGDLEYSIYQFDVQYIEDSALFVQSAVQIGFETSYAISGLQLASDGKIYVAQWTSPISSPYLGVIHKPWEQGVNCQYDSTGVFLDPGECDIQLPSILMDYLYRFDFEGICEKVPFEFTPFFHPEPVNILWDFGDPASGSNTSIELNPTHAFSGGGNFEVSVVVEYPSGRIEETSRKVEVEYTPEPDLGPDTTICSGEEVVLDAECGPYAYSWSTGEFGMTQITVSDTGWYWVRVVNDPGCIAFDSIYVGFRHPSLADTTNLIVSPTTCGGSNGVIRGLAIIGDPPFVIQWLDDMGNPIANTIDLFNLPVGSYTLQVIDSNNCITSLGPYSITDAGDILIEDVDYISAHCDQQDGSITVNATSGLSDMLFYSIDNGATYFSNQGIFTGLSPGSYAVRVKDSLECQDVFINNPIIIENLPGPLVSNVVVTPSIVGQNTGGIEIIASGSSDTLYYSNNNGSSYQENNGLFSSLAAGFYTCVVMDEYGCDTTFIIEVTEEISIRLKAVAGDDEVCPGNSAFVPLIVSNFNESGVSLSDSTPMTDLVFQSIDPGLSFVEWDGSPGASFFENSTGVTIPVDYFIGTVKIYNNVSFDLYATTEACQGDTLQLMPMVWISNGVVTYLWTEPSGDTSSNMILTINNIQPSQAGLYSILVTDTLGCYSDTTFAIFLYPSTPEFAIQDTIFTDDPFDLDAGAGFIHYLWNTGDTTQMIWIEEKGWYSAEVESPEGCIGVDSSYVLFSTPPELIKIYFPNAFTPNGDGLNDEFKPVTATGEIEHFSLSIFNRWGALIYQTNDISQGWDGTYKGEFCMPGAYVYKIAYSSSTSSNMTSEVKMGIVMLVR
ncbi:MAG: gliding motility-associated C-terminal domain-containing protein [Bacteroidetes bacterium]|nr:gliding motility-associated C-terminal domain-containing protein [Bacteroidota bacterium]MBL6944823.1 gliding motility-associated C-terminal domain-containing protein [Bacteroidales bacterium]